MPPRTVSHNGRTTTSAPAPSTVQAPDEVFDLDALEAEEEHRPFRFRLGGEVFEMAHIQEMDWSVAVLLEQGQIDVMLAETLGDQYEAFRDLGLPSWKMDELMIAWGQHVGIPLEKLQASPDSSASTGARSRRTSGGTTASGSRASRRAR
jgi:hypothetical protein